MMTVSFTNINILENDQDIIEYYNAFNIYGDETLIEIVRKAYTKRDEYYHRRYQGFAPNNLKYNIDNLLGYFVLDDNRLLDLENAQMQCDFRHFYNLLNIEELVLLGW